MATLPDIAVVIPLYNGARWIGETLASVMAQTHTPREVVVVDDGSTDGSAALAAAFDHVQVIRNPGSGANSARRYGQERTTAPLLAFLDQDDVWHPDHLGLLAQALLFDHAAPAALSTVKGFTEPPPAFASPSLKIRPIDPWDQFPGSSTSTPSAVLIRRLALDSVGGWSNAFTGVGDFYTWLRLSERGPLLLNRFSSVAYRMHDASQSHALRADRLRMYLSQKVRAAGEATRHREVAHPHEAIDMDRLRRIVTAMEALTLGLSDDDSDQVASAAESLEQAVVGGPDQRIDSALNSVFYYLRPLLNDSAESERVWDLLVKAWPSSAARTRDGVASQAARRLGVRRIGRDAFHQPLDAWRWAHLARVLRARAAAKVDRS